MLLSRNLRPKRKPSKVGLLNFTGKRVTGVFQDLEAEISDLDPLVPLGSDVQATVNISEINFNKNPRIILKSHHQENNSCWLYRYRSPLHQNDPTRKHGLVSDKI